MMQALFKTLAVAAFCAMTASAADFSSMCVIPPSSLTQAKSQYPSEAFALDKVAHVPMGTWYVDSSPTDTPKVPAHIVSSCPESSSLFVIIYGLPNKDCEAGYSDKGYNKNQSDYRVFIQNLVDAVGDRKALYVLEPDAVGLAANGGCAVESHFVENVQMALGMLSNNTNAEIYLDVGFWTLTTDESALKIANVVKELQKGGRIKGIVLNSDNYHANKQIAGYCSTFQKAYGDDSLHCIIDTSRNYNQNPPSDEWCNAVFGGIGHPPTADTGFPNIDYFVWIKIPGESDGECNGSDRSKDAMVGPAAGVFFNEQFIKLWNQGWFVLQEGMKPIPDPYPNITAAPATTTPPATTAPVTSTVPATSAPATSAPVTPKPNNSALFDINTLCAPPAASLVQAKKQYPDEAFALDEVLKVPMATWYVDSSPTDTPKVPANIVASCPDPSSSLFIVVYGLPHKDCEAGYSNKGYNQNQDDYRVFIQNLIDAVGDRKVIYELEPDAVGLAANGGCAVDYNYVANVQMALGMLSKNPNAIIYLDVGFWRLMNDADSLKIANVVKDLQKGGRIQGIVLNSDNYHANKEIAGYCSNFQKAYGDNSLHCIIDTSRNYNQNPPSDEWCNARFGGIGHPPTADTGFSNIDYFVWIKIPGESDGECNGSDRSKDAMVGPAAGAFFNEQFIKLWNQGWFVQQEGMAALPDPEANVTTAPVTTGPVSTAPVTTVPVSTEPVKTSKPPKPTKTPKSPKPTKTEKPPKPTKTPKPPKPTKTPKADAEDAATVDDMPETL